MTLVIYFPRGAKKSLTSKYGLNKLNTSCGRYSNYFKKLRRGSHSRIDGFQKGDRS